MHRNVYQALQPPSCLAILIRNMSILQQNILKQRYFMRQASKPTLTRCRKKLVILSDYQLKVSVFLVT